MRAFAIVALAVVTTGSALADERPVQLTNAPGLDRVEAHCGACHSLDYLVMNSPFLNAAAWDAEVAKMISAFGASIDQADAKVITDYLKANYGADRHDSPPQQASHRQLPTPRTTAKSTRDRREAKQESSRAWEPASGSGAGRVDRCSASRHPSRVGLFEWLITRLATNSPRSTNSHECWHDEGYGRRTPCGAGGGGGTGN